jgi:hypothetical protein
VPGFLSDAEQFEADCAGLGLEPISTGIAVTKVLGIKFGKSDRYLGPGQITKDPKKGPLFGTLTSFLTRVSQGDVGVINEWDNARKRVIGWQNAWVHELPKIPLTAAQYQRVKQLDPQSSVVMISPVVTPGAPSLPPAPPQVGPAAPAPLPPPAYSPAPMPGAPAAPPAPGAPPTYTPPVSQMPGGESPIPSQNQPPTQAGMFGGDMGKALIPGLIILGISMIANKGR